MKYAVLLLLVLMLGCGGASTSGSSSSTTPPPNGSLASGAWQFNNSQGQSSSEGTLLDFNLSQSGTTISVTGSTSCFDYGVNQPPYSGPGGLEGVTISGAPTCGGVSGSMSGKTVTIIWNTNTTFTGTLNANGSITGTSNNGITNNFTASPVSSPVPNGTYSGTFSEGFPGDIVLTTSSGTNYQLTGTMTVSGSGPYSLTGQLLGNILLLSGTVEGQPASFQMYYDATGSLTGTAHSITAFTNSGGLTTYSGQLTP
jgi:hypothetical protein